MSSDSIDSGARGGPHEIVGDQRTLVLIALVLSFTVVAGFVLGCGRSSPTETTNGQAAYWPTDGWRSSTPEEQGISSSALLKVLDRVDEQQLNLHSLLVIRNGYLVSEVYYNPFTAEMAAPVASVTKSVTSALVGIAIDKGYIKDEQAKVLSFFPNQTIANLDAAKAGDDRPRPGYHDRGLGLYRRRRPLSRGAGAKQGLGLLHARPSHGRESGDDLQLLDRRSSPSLRCAREGHR